MGRTWPTIAATPNAIAHKSGKVVSIQRGKSSTGTAPFAASNAMTTEAIFAPAVALRVDPDAPAGDDPYADPQYQVPDDLVW